MPGRVPSRVLQSRLPGKEPRNRLSRIAKAGTQRARTVLRPGRIVFIEHVSPPRRVSDRGTAIPTSGTESGASVA